MSDPMLLELRDKMIAAAMHLQCHMISSQYVNDPHADAGMELAEDMLDNAARAYVKYMITVKAENFGTH